MKDFCLLSSFLFLSLFVGVHPSLAGRTAWFNGTKGLRSRTVQRKKHSLTGTGKAICSHNSSYLLIFYLKHSDVNSIVPCQQPWGKVHFETKTDFLRAGKSDRRHRDKLPPGAGFCSYTPCTRELHLLLTSPRLPLPPPLQSRGRCKCFTVSNSY